MLSFSLRAVLRKESWMFCAGLFSICRSPCKLVCHSSWILAARGAKRPQSPGGTTRDGRLIHSFGQQPNRVGQHFVQYGLRPDFSTRWTKKFCKTFETFCTPEQCVFESSSNLGWKVTRP